MKCSSGWSGLFRAGITLICSVLVVACSQASPEPAPEFTLPISEVTATPPMQGDASVVEPAPRRLRYVAVPPGEKVEGMAHARIVLKHGKRTGHHPRHVHKKPVARPAAVKKKPTETGEPPVSH